MVFSLSRKYANDSVRRVNMKLCKLVDTPSSTSEKLSLTDGDAFSEDSIRYMSLGGALQ
jgi:hypothetical protein